jgi:hypothetical protein
VRGVLIGKLYRVLVALTARIVRALAARKWFENEAPPWAQPLPLRYDDMITLLNGPYQGKWRPRLVSEYAQRLRASGWHRAGGAVRGILRLCDIAPCLAPEKATPPHPLHLIMLQRYRHRCRGSLCLTEHRARVERPNLPFGRYAETASRSEACQRKPAPFRFQTRCLAGSQQSTGACWLANR